MKFNSFKKSGAKKQGLKRGICVVLTIAVVTACAGSTSLAKPVEASQILVAEAGKSGDALKGSAIGERFTVESVTISDSLKSLYFNDSADSEKTEQQTPFTESVVEETNIDNETAAEEVPETVTIQAERPEVMEAKGMLSDGKNGQLPAETAKVLKEEAVEQTAEADAAQTEAAAEETTEASAGESTADTTSYSWTGSVLTAASGVNYGPSGKETYYNLDMSLVVANMHAMGFSGEYWVRDDGVKMFGDYIMCAANLDVHPRGSLVESSLGTCIVCDTGGFAYYDPYQLDIAVTW